MKGSWEERAPAQRRFSDAVDTCLPNMATWAWRPGVRTLWGQKCHGVETFWFARALRLHNCGAKIQYGPKPSLATSVRDLEAHVRNLRSTCP